MPREIHADVNAGTSLVELLQEIDEREAKAEQSWLVMGLLNAWSLVDALMEMEENLNDEKSWMPLTLGQNLSHLHNRKLKALWWWLLWLNKI